MHPRTISILCVLLAFLIHPAGAAEQSGATRAPIYETDGKGMQRVKEALLLAKQDNKRVLLLIGGNWCGWCYKLHDLFEQNAEIHTLLQAGYGVVAIDEAADKEVLKKWRIQPRGYPYLTILDAAGNKLIDQETASLEKGPVHDPEKVLPFLTQWMAPPLDARNVMKEALEQARKEKKLLFVHFGTPGCSWCRQLEALLERKEMAAVFGKQFLDVKLDLERMTHGHEVQTGLAEKHGGGVPWYAVVDAAGKTLATSDGPRGNTGYPVTEEEIAHFMNVVKTTGAKLEPADLLLIESTVRARADEIVKSRAH
jgi:thioredoxin-related protein